MKIILDAFGGDNAPLEALKGAVKAGSELGVEMILSGDEKKIRECAVKNGVDLGGIRIMNADGEIEVEDSAKDILKSKKGTSMGVGLTALAAGEADAFVTAGSTAAVVIGGTFLVKRIRGVKRPAFGAIMPSNEGPFILLDMGANLDCTPKVLSQFADMGNIYMKKVLGVKAPRIALANIGVEENKGTALQKETYKLLKERRDIDFTGNIEVRDIPVGGADVVVADGFTGNVILKVYEGTALALMGNIKAIFKKNAVSMLSALMIKNGLMALKKKLDYKEFGGAPLLGLRAPVIKAHGSSDEKAFFSAIRQARDCVNNNVVGDIAAAFAASGEDGEGDRDD